MTAVSAATTRLVALLGHPVGHSASPAMHAAAFAAADVDAAYLAFDVEPGALADAVTGLRALGALGANITVPHKTAVLELVDRVTDEARGIGAANTLFWEAGAWVADNTDAAGLSRVLDDEVGLAPATPTVIVGAGGAARAAAVALGRAGARVRVHARRPQPARVVRDLAVAHGADHLDTDAPVTLVVNATPLGLRGESLPEQFMRLGPRQIALDLVYGAEPTPFLIAARNGGALAVDGRGMLLGQAIHAFERWIGQPAPREAMQSALDAQLAHALG